MKCSKIILAVLGTAALLCTGCGISGSGSSSVESQSQSHVSVDTASGGESSSDVAEDEESGTVIASDGLKIGVLYSSAEDTQMGESAAHMLGISGMQEELGLLDAQIISQYSVDPSDGTAVEKAVDELTGEGCQLVIATDADYDALIGDEAARYPLVKFLQYGSGMASAGNLRHYNARVYQGYYLAGMAAGMNTVLNEIGFVADGGTEDAAAAGCVDAFAMGVEVVNPDASVHLKIVAADADSDAEKAAAEQLVSDGCDVITQYSHTDGPQLAVKDASRVKGIGAFTDVSDISADKIMTCVTVDWKAYYTQAVRNVLTGSIPGDYYGGMGEGVVTLTALKNTSSDTEAAVKEIEDKIISGEFQVFVGEMETNDGTVIGSADEVLDDMSIGQISWYYRNVITDSVG